MNSTRRMRRFGRCDAHVKQIFMKLGLEVNPDLHRRVLAVLVHFRGGG
jgi:hypothetical protein